MTSSAVSVKGVGVTYRAYVERNSTMRRVLARGRLRQVTKVVALNDVSFEVQRGETLGLVGDNGAGKSTLLRVIARTLRPDTGSVEIRGETSTLLQLGAGFNKELSGRRNVYLSGLAHGLRTGRDRQVASTASSATRNWGRRSTGRSSPISSGMVSRLAFSISIHLLPDILLLDEVLAVGDAGFRKKSREAMRDMLGRGRHGDRGQSHPRHDGRDMRPCAMAREGADQGPGARRIR